ncbi:hypothetical protein A2Y83_00180 [Candidatus Falkowbacteria bacterium RBG_13_39_14]|uniref:Probable endonuclease 4 n=1 Tax=Candidatus Falkowbacteria bacterium RBG_13_39_14 TaxID=1797985 RepID=A0A1F5S9P8_9BACT|nr:MAG: hypothetical protein A2Y83_00180 [Candidatus Falkowbacteria bacterium RBG_13_39_14]
MFLGLHVSIAGGIDKAPERAGVLGCECFQMFTRSPHGGAYNIKFSKETIAKFKGNCKKFQLTDYYIHCPYYINLASGANKIFYGSVASIKKEIEIAELISAKGVIVHLGSAKDLGEREALQKTIKGLNLVLAESRTPLESKRSAGLLIEISAGAGLVMGDSFDEIAEIIKGVKNKKRIGVCFDTAHSFESGYDLRTPERAKKVFAEFDEKIGLDKLELIHCNDSKSDFNSHLDRHEHIGEGKIGLPGLQAVVDFAKSRNINIIAETPYGNDGDDRRNLEKLKGMRG